MASEENEREESARIREKSEVLAEALAQNYISIAEVDLTSGKALIIKANREPELNGMELSWDQLTERCAARVYEEDRPDILALTLDRLRDAGREGGFLAEVRGFTEQDQYDWLEVYAMPVRDAAGKCVVAARNINRERIMRHIVEAFVYRTMDYFFVVNAKDDSYTMFSGNLNGMPLPPSAGNNYTEEMVRYNKRYVVPEDYAWVTENMRLEHVTAMLDSMDQYTFTNGAINDQGEYHRLQIRFSYYDKQAGLILLSRTDVTQIYEEEQAKNAKLAAAIRQAQCDPLTGLYNQRATGELISRCLEQQYRRQAAVLFVDVDNFKMVNDTCGHGKGDELLAALAGILQDTAGWNGIAGRVGGDEFLLFLPNMERREDIIHRAGRICGAFARRRDLIPLELPVTCSVGIALYPQDGTEYEVLSRKADQALYTSKRYGKNTYYFYSETPDSGRNK